MSEYQYYEFQAIDRPLGEAGREALRALSTRARITATSLTNSYQWGGFKGSPKELTARWFDLYLYLANWGDRRLMIRFPAQAVDAAWIGRTLANVHCATIAQSGEHLILDISRNEQDEDDDDDWDDGSGWLGVLAQLRADVLNGDMRLFHLFWLTAVEDGSVADHAPEPVPGIGPLSGALEAFAQFFMLDADLVAAAAERSPAIAAVPERGALRRVIDALPDAQKTDLLLRLVEGDGRVAHEIRAMLRQGSKAVPADTAPRTAGDLRRRAHAYAKARQRAEAERQDAERKRKAAEEARARRARLDALEQQGEAAWQQLDLEVERRNAGAYDRAIRMLHDLKALAEEEGRAVEFAGRLSRLRQQHARKASFIARLKDITT